MPPKVNISSQAGSIIKVLKIYNLLIFIFSLIKNEAGFPGGSCKCKCKESIYNAGDIADLDP